MEVVYTTNIGDCPAAIDRRNGILYINHIKYQELTPFQQKFVYHHEMGHYHLDTDSEIKADAYAFDQLAGTEFRSLKQCLECLTEILDKDNPTLKPRYDALLQRALEWDAANGNEQAQFALNKGLNYYTYIFGMKFGKSEQEKADAYYTKSQADSLYQQSAAASEAQVKQSETMVIFYLIMGLVLALYLLG